MCQAARASPREARSWVEVSFDVPRPGKTNGLGELTDDACAAMATWPFRHGRECRRPSHPGRATRSCGCATADRSPGCKRPWGRKTAWDALTSFVSCDGKTLTDCDSSAFTPLNFGESIPIDVGLHLITQGLRHRITVFRRF